MQPNPYAPPSSDGAPPPSGIVFSEEGLLLVHSLARWMQALGWLCIIGAVLLGIGALFILTTVGPLGLVFLAGTALLWIGGWLLREAAGAFERGVGSDDEMSIGQGFRRLRSYFVLF